MSEYDEKLNSLLKQVEFPGENRKNLAAHLEKSGFTEKVMTSIRQTSSSRMNIFTWLIFSSFNFLLLVLFGSSKFILGDFFISYPGLSQFFFLFLGLTLFGGLAGLILSNRERPPHIA